MNRRYRLDWQRAVGDRLNIAEGYSGIVSYVEQKGGVFAGWEMLAMPASESGRYIDYAVKVACGSWGHAYQGLFLEWAIAIADRALTDPRFEIESENSRKGWRNKGIFPGNHGATLAAAALARAMRDNAPPSEENCAQAAREIAQTALESKGADWDDWNTQGSYLRAVQLLLIAGEPDEAKALFKIKRNLKHVKVHFEWLKTFVMAIPNSAEMYVADSALAQHFDEQFDVVRNPAYIPAPRDDTVGGHLGQNLMLLRVELALIRQRYVLGQTCRANWQDIIGLISA